MSFPTVIPFQVNAMISINMLGASMSQSVGLLMSNAVSAEKGSQTLQNAGVTQCCALMIAIGAAGAAS